MADLSILSPVSADYPTASTHLAIKAYVDDVRADMAINARTAAYTLVLTDHGKMIEVNSASALQVTVPTNASVAFPVGTVIRVRKTGTGNVSVVGATGVTVNWASVFTIATRYTYAEIHKQSADVWVGMVVGS